MEEKTCQCKRSDAWRCAVDQQLSTVTCHCHCHKRGPVKLEDQEVKKTSAEWYEDCPYVILDADGWDRANFNYSWHEMLITKAEFDQRALHSTIGNVGSGYPDALRTDTFKTGG